MWRTRLPGIGRAPVARSNACENGFTPRPPRPPRPRGPAKARRGGAPGYRTRCARRAARRAHRVLYPGAPPRRAFAGPRGRGGRGGRGVNPFSHALDRATGARPIPGNLVRHIAISSDALDAMLEMIANAERTVHFENYIIRD